MANKTRILSHQNSNIDYYCRKWNNPEKMIKTEALEKGRVKVGGDVTADVTQGSNQVNALKITGKDATPATPATPRSNFPLQSLQPPAEGHTYLYLLLLLLQLAFLFFFGLFIFFSYSSVSPLPPYSVVILLFSMVLLLLPLLLLLLLLLFLLLLPPPYF